jgi:hypothetical protein
MMLELAEQNPFRGLPRGPWQLFQAIAMHWGPESVEAWPSQETLGRAMRVTSRSVRAWTATLELAGAVVLRRELRADGHERIYYAPGPATRAALEHAGRKWPRPPPEMVSATPPEMVSEELNIKIQENFSSRVRARASTAEEKTDVTTDDEQAARDALGELAEKKHPRRPRPRVFDADAVAAAAACARSIEGGNAAKLEALRFAMAGAWSVSDGAPSSRFIFGTLEHFAEHLERGQARARALERTPHRPPREAVAKPIDGAELAHVDEVRAELERLGLLPSQNPRLADGAKTDDNPPMRTPVPVVDK